MKKITKLEIELPDHKEMESLLKKELPNYEVKYKAFSDIWEFNSENIRHSLFYYSDKSSKLITEKDKEFKESIIINITLLALIGVFIYLKKQNNWDFDFFWYLMVIGLFVNWLVLKFKPDFQKKFDENHKQLVDYFSKYERK